MRGLQLYQTESDEHVLIEEAIRLGCWLVPDIPSSSSEAHRLHTVEEFRQARLETRHFYIFSSRDQGGALSVRKVDKGNSHFFYVSPGVGTPSLEFLGGGVFVSPETQMRLIRPGFLEYSPDYWATDLSRKLASPPELASLFERLCVVAKSHSVRIKPGKSIFWVGEDARSEMEKGARLVGYEAWNGRPILPEASKRRAPRS
jgi:hypothetical protein